MSIFQELVLTWKGVDYRVAPDNMLRLIAQVEDVITLNELYNYSQKGAAPLSKLSLAYGLMLRYAGAKVQDEEVYRAIATGKDKAATTATQSILMMMLPPEDLIEGNEQGK
jgi:hypothetical protein